MELSWKDNPFLRILLPLMAGILVYNYLPHTNWGFSVLMLLLITIIVVLFNKLGTFTRHRLKWLKGLMLQLFIGSFAYILCQIYSVSNSEIWYAKWNSQFNYALVKIMEDAQEKEKSVKIIVDVSQLIHSNKHINVRGSAILYLQKSTQSKSLRMGDFILIRNLFKDIKSMGNPGEFNYASYCHLQQIYQSAYLRESQWKLTNQHAKNLFTFLNDIGRSTRDILKKNITNPISLGIAEALLMGYRNDIDSEVWQDYSNSGIVHIIAISGMHMAMIYVSVRWLLLLIPFLRTKRILTTCIAIFSMWFFAGMTGLPPSVTRAAIMFTCWGIGDMLDKKVNGVNNLTMSATVLLCINPFWLFDVGFQLSYLAVLSLILFYSSIYQRIVVPNFLVDQVWKLLSATLAAQILTFPLCIYYFHQFPLLFLFTNLIAVPATTIILYLEIVFLLLSWIQPLAKFLGSLISLSIEWMNKGVSIISHWSFALWDGIYISSFQVIILYACTFLIAYWLYLKRVRLFKYALLLILVFGIINLNRTYSISTQQKLLVYNISGKTRLEFIKHHQYFSPDEDSNASYPKLKTYTIKPSHLKFGLTSIDSSTVSSFRNSSMELYSFENKIILRVLNTKMKFSEKVSIDYLILSKSSRCDKNWISMNCLPKLIILDSSIPQWKLEQYKSTLTGLNIPVYCVNEKGAFMASF